MTHKILWANLGYPFYRNWFQQLLQNKLLCFYQPEHGGRVREVVENNNYDLLVTCEIVSRDDAASLSAPDAHSSYWAYSQYHTHGKAVVGSTEIAAVSTVFDEQHIDIVDSGDYYIIPVHLHWARPDIRLAQARAIVRAARTLTKPVLVVGDFNIWMLFGHWFLFRDDSQAYRELCSYFVESSRHIRRTFMIPGVKLDYVFATPDISNNVTCRTVKRIIPGNDHYPIEIVMRY